MSTTSWILISIICAITGAIFGVGVGLFVANPERKRAPQFAPRPAQALGLNARRGFRVALALLLIPYLR